MNTNKNQNQWQKATHYSSIWIINMHHILYFMSKLWNNTQIIDLPKWSVSHTNRYAHQSFSLSYSQFKITYVFYMLPDPLPWPASLMISNLLSFFLWIRFLKMIILTCLPLPLLYFSFIWNRQTKIEHFHF